MVRVQGLPVKCLMTVIRKHKWGRPVESATIRAFPRVKHQPLASSRICSSTKRNTRALKSSNLRDPTSTRPRKRYGENSMIISRILSVSEVFKLIIMTSWMPASSTRPRSRAEGPSSPTLVVNLWTILMAPSHRWIPRSLRNQT